MCVRGFAPHTHQNCRVHLCIFGRVLSQIGGSRMSVNPKRTILILSTCLALQMTSFVLILPLFARRFSQLGAGVEALGESAMAYALAATLAAPFMGALADRFGRRRVALVSLGVYVLAFTGYLLAPSAGWIILL